MLNNTATITNPIKEYSIANEKINALEKNPANGGIPASENKVRMIITDSTGFIFERFVNEVKYFRD